MGCGAVIRSAWDNRREGVVVVAAQDARQTPEGIGSDSQLRTMTLGLGNGKVVHNSCSAVTSVPCGPRAECSAEIADRPALDWFHF